MGYYGGWAAAVPAPAVLLGALRVQLRASKPHLVQAGTSQPNVGDRRPRIDVTSARVSDAPLEAHTPHDRRRPTGDGDCVAHLRDQRLFPWRVVLPLSNAENLR
jgi:hypothetical protein